MDNGVHAAVNGGIIRAEICDLWQSSAPSHSNRLIHQLAHALALCGRDRYHRDAERGAHFLHIDGTAVGTHLIHHIQRQHHRYPQLQQLKCQVKITLILVASTMLMMPSGFWLRIKSRETISSCV